MGMHDANECQGMLKTRVHTGSRAHTPSAAQFWPPARKTYIHEGIQRTRDTRMQTNICTCILTHKTHNHANIAQCTLRTQKRACTDTKIDIRILVKVYKHVHVHIHRTSTHKSTFAHTLKHTHTIHTCTHTHAHTQTPT